MELYRFSIPCHVAVLKIRINRANSMQFMVTKDSKEVKEKGDSKAVDKKEPHDTGRTGRSLGNIWSYKMRIYILYWNATQSGPTQDGIVSGGAVQPSHGVPRMLSICKVMFNCAKENDV